MKLHIFHRTVYEYSSLVRDSFNETRLQPVSALGQECVSFLLKVVPVVRLSHYFDFHGNFVHFFEIAEAHPTLLVEASSVVKTVANRLAVGAASVPLARLPECVRQERCHDFLQSSHYIELSPEVWRLALDASVGQGDVWQCAVAMMRFIHANFSYVPYSTNVNTHTTEVVRQRRGVCQDFAHVMIGMCRSVKIPARYVSGYLYNGPMDSLVGAQASHAWCEVYVPDLGWLGLDPTNNQAADEHYVRVAVGRDHADVPMIRGTYKGGRAQSLAVEVRVTAAE